MGIRWQFLNLGGDVNDSAEPHKPKILSVWNNLPGKAGKKGGCLLLSGTSLRLCVS
jgi:hypothetical protein